MKMYYLIYSYHDLFMDEFYAEDDLNNYLEYLKKEYKNDSDFHYKVIVGREITNEYR